MTASSEKIKANQKLNELNKLLSDLITKLQTLDPSQLTQSEGSSWTVLEVVEHLMKTEAISLSYVNYKVNQGTVFKKASFRQKYNGWIMMRAYNSRIKYKAPDGVSPDGEYKSLEEAKEAFMKVRQELYAFMKDRDDKDFLLVMYKHPLFGRLTLFQMLQFFEGHFLRHSKQIDRILKSVS